MDFMMQQEEEHFYKLTVLLKYERNQFKTDDLGVISYQGRKGGTIIQARNSTEFLTKDAYYYLREFGNTNSRKTVKNIHVNLFLKNYKYQLKKMIVKL